MVLTSCGFAARMMISAFAIRFFVSLRVPVSPNFSALSSVALLPLQEIIRHSFGNPLFSKDIAIDVPKCPNPTIPIISFVIKSVPFKVVKKTTAAQALRIKRQP